MEIMNKTKSRFCSIKSRAFVIFVSIFMATLAITFVSVFCVVSKDLEKLAIESARQEIHLGAVNLEMYIDSLKKAYYTVDFSKEIIGELQKPPKDINYQKILNTMEGMVYHSESVYSIYIEDIKNGVVLSTETMSAGKYKREWFRQYLPGEEEELRLRPTLDITSDYNKMFSYIGEMKVDFFGETVAYVSVNVLRHQLEKMIIEDEVYVDSIQFIVDEDGQLIAGNQKFEGGSEMIPDERTENFLYMEEETKDGFRYGKLIPRRQMLSSVYKVGLIFILSFLGFAVIILVVIHKLLDYVVAPIYELSEKIRSYRQTDNAVVEFKTDRTDEFAYLFKSLEDMIAHIDYLIDELYQQELYKKEMQLKLYRLSINPHFIFNILDSVGWTLKFKDYEKAEAVLTNFSDFFRNALSQNKDYVTIHEMRQWIASYSYLASFLKDDRIKVEMNIGEELDEIRMPSLLLQPIIENSFKYAFAGRSAGIISVDVTREGDILKFCIGDDGIGMNQETLDHVISRILSYDIRKSTRHFGLASVYQRLELVTGGTHGFRIISEEQKGTKVYFQINI